MANTGKKLENLVEVVEKIFAPEGFSVEARRLQHSERGVPLAEFDVFISGHVGTTTFSWLIECRDRPSEGPAPGEWIEQLVGRRQRFNVDKVSVVSTTGFAEGAVDFARSEGIELRTVGELSVEEIEEWFHGSHLDLHVMKGSFRHAEVILAPDTPDKIKEAARERIRSEGIEAKMFSDREGKVININNAWQHVLMQNPQMFAGIPIGAGPHAKNLSVTFESPEDRYTLQTGEGDAAVVRLEFEASLEVELRQVPINDITRYSVLDTGESIVDSVHFETELEDRTIELQVHRLLESDKGFISVRGSS